MTAPDVIRAFDRGGRGRACGFHAGPAESELYRRKPIPWGAMWRALTRRGGHERRSMGGYRRFDRGRPCAMGAAQYSRYGRADQAARTPGVTDRRPKWERATM